jgi:hypothetical protein
MWSLYCLLQLIEPKIRVRNFLIRGKPSMFTEDLRARSVQKVHILASLFLDLAESLDHRDLESELQGIDQEEDDRYLSVHDTFDNSIFVCEIEDQRLDSILLDCFGLPFGPDKSVEFLVSRELGSAQLSKK